MLTKRTAEKQHSFYTSKINTLFSENTNKLVALTNGHYAFQHAKCIEIPLNRIRLNTSKGGTFVVTDLVNAIETHAGIYYIIHMQTHVHMYMNVLVNTQLYFSVGGGVQ